MPKHKAASMTTLSSIPVMWSRRNCRMEDESSAVIVLRTLSMRATNQRRPEKPTAATPLKANAMANHPARAELIAPTVPVTVSAT